MEYPPALCVGRWASPGPLCSPVYSTSSPSTAQQDEPAGLIPQTPVSANGRHWKETGGWGKEEHVSPPAPLPGVSSLAAAPAFTAQACLVSSTLGSRSTVSSLCFSSFRWAWLPAQIPLRGCHWTLFAIQTPPDDLCSRSLCYMSSVINTWRGFCFPGQPLTIHIGGLLVCRTLGIHRTLSSPVCLFGSAVSSRSQAIALPQKLCILLILLVKCACVGYLFSRVWLFWLYGLGPTRLLCPWDFPGKNIGVGCRFLLQGIFPAQGPASPALADGYWATREAHIMQSQSFIPLFLNTSFTRLDFGPQVIPTWSSRHPKIDSQWEGARDKTQKGRSSQVCEPQLQVKKFALCP